MGAGGTNNSKTPAVGCCSKRRVDVQLQQKAMSVPELLTNNRPVTPKRESMRLRARLVNL